MNNPAVGYDICDAGRVLVGTVISRGYSYAAFWLIDPFVSAPQLIARRGVYSHAYGVSAYGGVIVGEFIKNANSQFRAFRWTRATGMQDLGTLPGGNWSVAYDVTADGSVIVGSSTYGFDGSARAFRWTKARGMEDLNITYAKLVLTQGSLLTSARAISRDGRFIVGQGLNGNTGRYEAFLLDTCPDTADEEKFMQCLLAPWAEGQYWIPSTRPGHVGGRPNHAIDFNLISAPREECPFAEWGDPYADCNQVVVASHGGRAYTMAQARCIGYGNYVVVVSNVRPASGVENTYLATLYAHLNHFLVPNGASVSAGEPIGRAGNTGGKGGDPNSRISPHLHFEVREVEISGSRMVLGKRRQVLDLEGGTVLLHLSGQPVKVFKTCNIGSRRKPHYVGIPIRGTVSVETIPPNLGFICQPRCGGAFFDPPDEDDEEGEEDDEEGEEDDMPIVIDLSDVNGDGCVDDTDLLQVLFAFGSGTSDLAADVNFDGFVDDADLLEVLFNFGSGC
jgi:probable HAF family extracellular repeat protein